MTESVVIYTDLEATEVAGRYVGDRVRAAFKQAPPDVLIVFAPPNYDYPLLLATIAGACAPRIILGGSAVGGFTSGGYLPPTALCAVAIRSDEIVFTLGVGRGLRESSAEAARQMVAPFKGLRSHDHLHRAAIVLVDALAGHGDLFTDEAIVATGGLYHLFGGGTADGARMSLSRLFVGTDVISDAAVALEVLSNKPIGVGLCQGWRATSAPLRVTAADGVRVRSLNGIPAGEMFRQHADRTGQIFDPQAPIPFFLDNILGIAGGHGFKFRVPVALEPDGSVICAAEVPEGAVVNVMATSAELAAAAADDGVSRARGQLGAFRPEVALFFDCLASQARMELGFGFDPKRLAVPLGTSSYAGFSTCGQVVRAEGEFNGFQNCTAVVCVIPA